MTTTLQIVTQNTTVSSQKRLTLLSSQPSAVHVISIANQLRTDLANDTDPAKGSALVGFLQSGTGAVGRTAQAKMRDIVSVKDFGAVGDGVTDDTAAIQAAIDSLPLNTAATGTLTPKGFANGGTIRFPRGRYKVTSTVNLNRGVKLIGEGREASQILSFCAGSVFSYQDAGRYVPDAICVEGLSVWQDSSVVATSGAAFSIIDGPASTQAIFFSGRDLLIEGTYHGVRLSAAIACSLSDSMITGAVSHGVMVPAGVGFTQSTSINFSNVYSQQSQTGSGFYVKDAAYVNFSACAADTNGRFGYELDSTTAVSVHGGAEQNVLGGAYCINTRSTRLLIAVVDSAAANSNGVTLYNADQTEIFGVLSATGAATGYGVFIESSSVGTINRAVMTGAWNGVNRFNTLANVLDLNRNNQGFLGGAKKNWSFGVESAPNAAYQFQIGGDGESTVHTGLVCDPTFTFAGSSNSVELITPRTKATAVTYTVLNGIWIQDASKGEGSTITRLNGITISEQVQGTNANSNIALATSSPAAGNWNIYSASTRDNVWFGKQRYLSSTGPTQSFGAGSPEGVVTAPVGSQYGRTDGGAGTSFYVKETGAGNTGWVAK